MGKIFTETTIFIHELKTSIESKVSLKILSHVHI